MRYHNPNDEFLSRHLSEFVKEHGGEWVIIAGGELIGFAYKENLTKLIKKARKLHPADTPLVSPIPKEEEIECIL